MHVQLISKQNVDFGTLLTAVYRTTGLKISEYADKSTFDMSDSKKLATCLSALAGLSPDQITPAVMSHLTFSMLAIIYTDELSKILTLAGPIRWLGTNTNKREVMIGVFTGDLNQWRDAVTTGIKESDTSEFFQLVKKEFVAQGYASLWPSTDKTKGKLT